MSLISALRTEDRLTENGMVTNSTSLNSCVDFFFQAGAYRKAEESDIIASFSAAFAQDHLRALKILFWAREMHLLLSGCLEKELLPTSFVRAGE